MFSFSIDRNALRLINLLPNHYIEELLKLPERHGLLYVRYCWEDEIGRTYSFDIVHVESDIDIFKYLLEIEKKYLQHTGRFPGFVEIIVFWKKDNNLVIEEVKIDGDYTYNPDTHETIYKYIFKTRPITYIPLKYLKTHKTY